MIKCLLLEQVGEIGTPILELEMLVIPRVGETIETSRRGKDEVAHYRVLEVNHDYVPLNAEEDSEETGKLPIRKFEGVTIAAEFLGVFNPEIVDELPFNHE